MNYAYDAQEVERRWQARWAEEHAFEVANDDPRPPFYVLCMYPYPSGAAHQGHVRNYTFGDLNTRWRTMQGFSVLSPIGFDSFGLPAENAAIKTGTHPRIFTDARIEELQNSLRRLGAGYDWRRVVKSHDPIYMRFNQVIFRHFLEAGLAYRKKAPVNWCPGCNTVLANEQVKADGTCERSGDVVVKKDLEQWFFRITAYADELLAELDNMEWPERVKVQQRNWIGRSEGAQFQMGVADSDERIEVFTTRPDTAFGMTFVVLAPEHPLVDSVVTPEHRAAVDTFVERVRQEPEFERQSAEGPVDKRGIFTGAYAVNPFNNQPVPIYLADYVLMGYGTGAIMAVPAEDQRDWDFATAYGLPILRTVQPPEGWEGEAYTGDGPRINSEWLNGITDTAKAKAKATAWLEERGLGAAASSTACATGSCRGSVTGAAPYRLSTAQTTGSYLCPRNNCRSCCPTTSNSCPQGNRRCATTNASCGPRAPAVASAPNARRTRWTHSSTRPGISCDSATPGPPMGPSTARPWNGGCPWTSTSAGSNTPSCTFFTPASTPAP